MALWIMGYPRLREAQPRLSTSALPAKTFSLRNLAPPPTY